MIFDIDSCMCDFDDCREPPTIHGFCRKHYEEVKTLNDEELPRQYMDLGYWASLLPVNNT